MSEPVKSEIAASRALYFSGLQEVSPPPEQVRVKRPSYVGISTALNGYTPYAPYRTSLDGGRKISPPLHLPAYIPPSLDSVSLVLNQGTYQRTLADHEGYQRTLSDHDGYQRTLADHDGYQRSLAEFDQTMRDLNMGRPQTEDITDNGSIMHADDQFYPRSHIKQVIDNGSSKSVTTITKFHSPQHTKPNLVSKQIERLYGSDSLAQVRLTSPEPPARNGSNDVTDFTNDVTSPERKLSGGFFSKRFGITKMKDHSTLKSPETPKEYKPLKVPAVFKLLRPEFREQLKQSSCKVSMPEEGGKERIIPIRLESSPAKQEPSPARNDLTPTRPRPTPDTTPRSTERVIPITRLSNGDINGARHVNGSSNGHVNGVSPVVNGFTTPAAGGGVTRRSAPTVIGFRTPPSDKTSDRSEVPAKPLVIRKLSPLSPKHIVVPTSAKPAPAPKPEHLMSPPLSPVPSDETRSPPLSRTGSIPSPRPAASPESTTASSPVPPPETAAAPEPEQAEPTLEQALPEPEQVQPPEQTPELEKLSLETTDEVVENLNGEVEKVEEVHEVEDVEDASPEEMEEVSEKDIEEYSYDREQDQYPDYFQCGLRERELLCPILEEDNESTASGSILNLQSSTGGVYSPDDPLLIADQGEGQDGHYFIKVLENETFKFEEQICDFEEELAISSDTDIPEEYRENILSTVGLAKLLMAQKLAQFRGLCDKNITVTKEEDPFVPTRQDLAGFWDMVHIQVEQVHGRFAELQKLRSQGWKLQVAEVPELKNNKTKAKKGVNKNVNKPIKSKEKSEAAKARDEARKKMLEMKKRAMKENPEPDLVIMM